jgi:hypothetical protein
MRGDPVSAQREDKRGKFSIEKLGHFYYGLESLLSLDLLYEVPRPYSLRLTTLGSTRLYKLSARRRELYMTTHNIQKRLTSMLQAGFEPAVPASGQPQTHAIDRAATWIGTQCKYLCTNLQLVASL